MDVRLQLDDFERLTEEKEVYFTIELETSNVVVEYKGSAVILRDIKKDEFELTDFFWQDDVPDLDDDERTKLEDSISSALITRFESDVLTWENEETSLNTFEDEKPEEIWTNQPQE